MTNQDKRNIIQQMRHAGLLDHGAVFSGSEFREIFKLTMPKTGTKAEFDVITLEELSYAGFIKDILLNEGKYLKSERGDYRVLLPSENQQQIIAYMSQADKKLKRGIKLNKNTPTEFKVNHQDEARMIIKRESIKDHRSA